ncbi:MAG: PKD domain-containing protein [Bacteroidales bacterium]|nr:PKD domain-containing protein [Bacteroidales bacterium]
MKFWKKLPTASCQLQTISVRVTLMVLLLILQTGDVASQGLFRKALFLGNSYTYFNDLPILTATLASSNGDSLYYASNSPGGYTLGWFPSAHVFSGISLNMISNNNWDFVILQEQSQTPGLLPDSALILQQASDSIVFGYSFLWNANSYYPEADFSHTLSSDTLFTHNLSTGADQWKWDFGDGYTSNAFEPVHIYPSAATYLVSLVASNDCHSDSISQQVTVLPTTVDLMPDAGYRITLIGPDDMGNISVKGYNGSGRLSLFDLTGRLVSASNVISGQAIVSGLKKQLYIYVLVSKSGTILSQGKLIFQP